MAREDSRLMARYRSRPVGGERSAGVSRDAERKCISPVMDLAVLWYQDLHPQMKHNTTISLRRVLRGGVSHWIDVIISQSKNPVNFVPSNNNNNTNWRFDLRFLGHFFKQQKRLLMKSEHVPPLSTPSTLVFCVAQVPNFFAHQRRGRICFLLSASFFLQSRAKILNGSK